MTRPLRALALSALALVPLLALAGRPLQTEDAGILEPGAWELETAWTRVKLDRERSFDRYLQLGRGLGADSQVALAVGSANAGSERADLAAVVGKTELWNNGRPEAAAALTLAWSVDAAKVAGQGWEHAGTTLSLVYSRSVGAGLTLHANLSHQRDEQAGRRSTGWNLAFEHEGFDGPLGRLAPMGELFGDDHRNAWWNLGLRATLVPDRFWLDASWGRQFNQGQPKMATLGAMLAF